MIYVQKTSCSEAKAIAMRENYLAMLHDVELPEPRLVEWIAGGVYDMTKPVLLGQHEHRVKEAFHRIRRLNKCRSDEEFPTYISYFRLAKVIKYEQFMSLVKEDHLQRSKVIQQ